LFPLYWLLCHCFDYPPLAVLDINSTALKFFSAKVFSVISIMPSSTSRLYKFYNLLNLLWDMPFVDELAMFTKGTSLGFFPRFVRRNDKQE
jgi:hypothetical protein